MLRRAGLSRLSDLEVREPAKRYEHALPGDLVHIDTKKLGRVVRMGKCIPRSSRSPIGAGWEYLFVAIDDHARVAFTHMFPDEGKTSAVQFLENTIAYFASLGVRLKAVLTDNGPAFRSKAFGCLYAASMAKPNDSFSPRSKSGSMESRTTTPQNALRCSIAGLTTTTGTVLIKGSTALRP